MEKKRFFILCILIFISLFNFNLNEVKLKADGDINEEVTTTFVHSAGRTSSILLSKSILIGINKSGALYVSRFSL